MNNKVPVNRIESGLKDWRSKEERFVKLFSSDILKKKSFQQEKLKYFDSVQAKFGKTANEEESLALRILLQERNRIAKELYPNLFVRVLRRVIVFAKQKQVAKQAEQRSVNNEQVLKQAVLKAGFENVGNKLQQNIKEGQQEFSIPVSYYVNEKEKMDFNLFFARDQNGLYRFEKYKAALQSENNPEENREHHFSIEPDNIVTATHAYNLLSGRSIQKECISRENNKPATWIQLDFNDKDAADNYKIKEFQSAYSYDIRKLIQQLPLKELKTDESTQKLLTDLTNGDRQAVTLQKDRKETKLFIEANPQFKSLNVYDENLRKITMDLHLVIKTWNNRS